MSPLRSLVRVVRAALPRAPSDPRAFAFAVALAVPLFVGCKPEIGDSCKLSTDCSITGDRLCDTSQPDGYCTVFNCDPGTCPDEAMCVEFHPNSERFARRFCVRGCEAPSDCRPGYACAVLSNAGIDPQRDAKIMEGRPEYSGVCLP